MKVKKLKQQGGRLLRLMRDEFIALEEDYTAEPDISTSNVLVSTVGTEVSIASPEVKTAAESLVYIRRKEAKFATLEQERLGLEEKWDNIQKYTNAQIETDKERDKLANKELTKEGNNAHDNQAQQRTYMCNYIKNMGSHALQQLKKLSFDEVKELFETTMKRVNTITPMESDDTVPKVVAGSSKIDAEQEFNQESSKRQKIGEGSKPAEESKDELSQEQLQQLMIIVPEERMNVEALQTK
ncbi:hypothetical protein Tco_0309765 [Tanacetum coccineum]